MKLYQLVEPESRAGRVFAALVQTLILLSVLAFCVETLPDLSDEWRRGLRWFETVSVVLFTVEYGLRFAASHPRRKYVLSFFGIIDLLAILPFYVALFTNALIGVDLRSIRLFRMFRLIRVLKLVRYSRAARRFAMAFHMIRAELGLVLAACLFLLFVSSVGIYFFEAEAQPDQFGSVFHSMWWSLSTITTVGYGDVYPITTGGRIFTAAVLIAGLGIVAVPAGLVAGAVSRTMSSAEVAEAHEAAEHAFSSHASDEESPVRSEAA